MRHTQWLPVVVETVCFKPPQRPPELVCWGVIASHAVACVAQSCRSWVPICFCVQLPSVFALLAMLQGHLAFSQIHVCLQLQIYVDMSKLNSPTSQAYRGIISRRVSWVQCNDHQTVNPHQVLCCQFIQQVLHVVSLEQACAINAIQSNYQSTMEYFPADPL